MNKTNIIKIIVNYLKEYKVKEIGIFGSFARNEMTDDSDIDILVEYNRGTTLFDIVKMKQELYELTGRKVDLVSKRAIRKKIMEIIQTDLQTVYHA
ncbi:MAG: nucleotidyltransferase family protein [Bacteroidia bacterium]|nr:nucleotidyltransferase family protein [Bacteroidia bacterium]